MKAGAKRAVMIHQHGDAVAAFRCQKHEYLHSVRAVGTGDAQPIKRHMFILLVVTPPQHQSM